MNLQRPFILISNDDGLYAEGLKKLWETLHQSGLFDLAIVAPATERSGTGPGVTWTKPILVTKIDWPENELVWSVDGTPADCIKMALTLLLKRKPDLIVSGINAGSNAGRNVLHSGTAGAVIEGIFRGIPGIALSCENDKKPRYSLAQKYLLSLINYILTHPLPTGAFLNVNFPYNVVNEEIKGMKLTKQGIQRWVEDPSLLMETTEGHSYWLGSKSEGEAEDPESDISFLHQGYMTAVPIQIHELTDHNILKERGADFSKFFT